MGAKGQVVIPKPLRDVAGLRPGVEVDFALDDGRVVLSPRPHRPRELGGRYAGSGMADRLVEDRSREPR